MRCPKWAGIVGGIVVGLVAGGLVAGWVTCLSVHGRAGLYVGVAAGAAVSGLMARRAGLWTGLTVGLLLGAVLPDLILSWMFIPIYARAQHMPPSPRFTVPSPNAELLKILSDTWLSSLLMIGLGALAGAAAGYLRDRALAKRETLKSE